MTILRRRAARPRIRPLATLASAALAITVLAGCSPWEEPAENQIVPLAAEGTLAAPGTPGNAFTYDPALAPEGATLRAEFTPTAGGTTGTLIVGGLQPDRGYAAHAHTRPCGPTGDDAGPHFQHLPDPNAQSFSPSVDPAFANPQNEYWLDVRTDAAGNGTSEALVPFPITEGQPSSVIVHEAMETATGPGEAGTAGGRVACLTVIG